MKKKILGIVMSLALVAQVLAVPTFAATEDIGLIIDSKGTTANYWTAYNENATVTTNETSVVLTDATNSHAKMVYAIPENDQIAFSQDNTVVIEMEITPSTVKTDTYGPYTIVRFNMPVTEDELAAYKTLTGTGNNEKYNDDLYAQSLGGFCYGYYYGIGGAYKAATVPYDGSKTYKMVAYISNNGTHAKTVFYEGTSTTPAYTNDVDLPGIYFNQSTILKNVAVTEMNPKNGTISCTVSSLKIYNVPNANASNYASYTERISAALVVENVKIGDVDLDGATNVTAGNITFTATGSDNVSATLSYVKNDYIGTKGTTEATLANDGENYTLTANLEPDSTYTLKITDGTSTESYTFTTADVYTPKYGLVASTEGATTDGFTLYNTTRDTMSAEADGYVRVAQGEKAAAASADPAAITYSLDANKIKFSDEDTIVIETRVRAGVTEYANYGSYLRVGYNMPKNASELPNVKVINKDNVTIKNFDKQGVKDAKNTTQNALALGGISHGYMYFENGEWVEDPSVTMKDTTSQWYKMVTVMNGTTIHTTIYDEAGTSKVKIEEATDIVFRSLSKYLENISISEVNPQDGKITTDVDYIRVYNMPKGYEENYADFTSIVEKEATMYKKTNGVLTIDADEVVIKDADNEDVDFVATETEDGLVVRMLDFTAGNYTVNGAKYVVTAPYTATLANGKFVTDIPEIFNAEGAIFYKANYDATTGRLLSVDVITEIVAETDSQTVATDATTKVFLWNANMKPIKLR